MRLFFQTHSTIIKLKYWILTRRIASTAQLTCWDVVENELVVIWSTWQFTCWDIVENKLVVIWSTWCVFFDTHHASVSGTLQNVDLQLFWDKKKIRCKCSMKTYFILAMPATISNRRPDSGQMRVPVSTWTSRRSRWIALIKSSSSRRVGLYSVGIPKKYVNTIRWGCCSKLYVCVFYASVPSRPIASAAMRTPAQSRVGMTCLRNPKLQSVSMTLISRTSILKG